MSPSKMKYHVSLGNGEFRLMAEVSFPVLVSSANAKEKRHLLAGREVPRWTR